MLTGSQRTPGKWAVTIGVGKDSGVMRVGKGSGHGTCLNLISFHGMQDSMVETTFLLGM